MDVTLVAVMDVTAMDVTPMDAIADSTHSLIYS
jgi:hypothetical protein